jgi:hypothetical protein
MPTSHPTWKDNERVNLPISFKGEIQRAIAHGRDGPLLSSTNFPVLQGTQIDGKAGSSIGLPPVKHTESIALRTQRLRFLPPLFRGKIVQVWQAVAVSFNRSVSSPPLSFVSAIIRWASLTCCDPIRFAAAAMLAPDRLIDMKDE